MSTLAMILTAAMAVPGNGPEMVSGEVEQGLDMRGQWEGTQYWGADGMSEAKLSKRRLRLVTFGGNIAVSYETNWECVDEGRGRLRLKLYLSSAPGIYRCDGDRVIICYREDGKGRPTSFRAGDGQHLLLLHRVKPYK